MTGKLKKPLRRLPHGHHDERSDEIYAHAKRRAEERYNIPGAAFAQLHKRLVAQIQLGASQPLEYPGNTRSKHWQAVLLDEVLFVVLYSTTYKALYTFAPPNSPAVQAACLSAGVRCG